MLPDAVTWLLYLKWGSSNYYKLFFSFTTCNIVFQMKYNSDSFY